MISVVRVARRLAGAVLVAAERLAGRELGLRDLHEVVARQQAGEEIETAARGGLRADERVGGGVEGAVAVIAVEHHVHAANRQLAAIDRAVVVGVVPDQIAEREVRERRRGEAEVVGVIGGAGRARVEDHFGIAAGSRAVGVAAVAVGRAVVVAGGEYAAAERALRRVDAHAVAGGVRRQPRHAVDGVGGGGAGARREVVLPAVCGHGRGEHGAARRDELYGHAVEPGFAGILHAVAVHVVPHAVADLNRRRLAHGRDLAEPVRLAEGGARRVRAAGGVEVVALGPRARGHAVPHEAAGAHGEAGVEAAREDVGEPRNLRHGAAGEFFVQPGVGVLVVVLAVARALAVVRAAGGTEGAGLGVRLERPAACEVARRVDRRKEGVAAGHALIPHGGGGIVEREEAELIAGAVAQADRDVAVHVEGHAAEERLRIRAHAVGRRLGRRLRGEGGNPAVPRTRAGAAEHLHVAARVVEGELQGRRGAESHRGRVEGVDVGAQIGRGRAGALGRVDDAHVELPAEVLQRHRPQIGAAGAGGARRVQGNLHPLHVRGIRRDAGGNPVDAAIGEVHDEYVGAVGRHFHAAE